jgi:YbbR domain-containing protein
MEKLVRQIIAKVSSYRRPKNWVLKLVSLFFALFLWYFVVGEDKVDMNVTLPVEIVNLPRDLIISNQFKKQIEVTISGQRSLIRGMAEQHISRSIDLSKATPGTIVIPNDPDSISLPRGLSILRVQPPTLTLLLDRLIQKELPIKPILVGKVHKDFRLDSVTVDPMTLKISGPQTILDQEEHLKTVPIVINDLSESAVKQVSLALKNEISDLIGEPIDFEHDKGKQTEIIYRLSPPKVSIKAEIPQGMIRKPNGLKSLFQARVKPENLQPGSLKLKVLVEAPTQVKIISVSPDTVTLKINETKRLKIKP